MKSGKENIQGADEAEEADQGDASILPNEEEGNSEGGDSSESCSVESPLRESQGEIKVEVAKQEVVTPPQKNGTSCKGTPHNEEGCANSDTEKKEDTNESVIQENGERQSSVQLSDGEGEREEITSGESATEEHATECARLSDVSFSEDFFDQASQFQKAPEDPNEQIPNQLEDLYKEMKKCEDLFLSHFDCTGDDSKQMEMTSNEDEARQEKNGKVSIPQIDFTSMEAISQFIMHKDMFNNDDPPIERHLLEHVQQFTQEQKKKNKKNKMNKSYLGVRSYLNTLPPSLHQKICKEYRKNF
ncbi:Uncharacterized protein PCOAH_00020650 [Plasmodium coatneyi]|uniref:Uncharacterized protein n=1 Tax=Plasmodium coatneyi TaxID=208452 RepID=A0A1B1DZ19_9APIC|nr:Uncharacterized protein PCOAH_00020650 [Plasmodium coatneyi]ANQ07837.1 Uncharacterized protein PCOAH_00020650 [Plasmodium coatneyi]